MAEEGIHVIKATITGIMGKVMIEVSDKGH